MADADPESSDTSESVEDLKRINSAPLFSIPAFFVGFGAKDSDSGRSPTSPLDFAVFGGLFSPRSPAPSSPRFSHRNRWFSDKVGLSVLSSSFGGEGSEGQSDDSLRITRDNIVLAPQIKAKLSSHQLFDPCLKSNSLPKNYAVPSLSDAVNIHPLPSDSVTDAWDIVVADVHTNSPRRSTSSPMDIISSQAFSRSLSGREMALSEDYTCIISHGPNPKTTHIFGDCILDCDPKELGGLGTEEELEKPKGDSPPDDSLSRLWLCTGKPQDCQSHIYKHREEAASAGKETDKGGVEDSLERSPGSGSLEPV